MLHGAPCGFSARRSVAPARVRQARARQPAAVSFQLAYRWRSYPSSNTLLHEEERCEEVAAANRALPVVPGQAIHLDRYHLADVRSAAPANRVAVALTARARSTGPPIANRTARLLNKQCGGSSITGMVFQFASPQRRMTGRKPIAF